MLTKNKWPQFRIGRNIIYAIVITTIFSITAASSGSAAFSFLDRAFGGGGFNPGAATTAYAQPAPTCLPPPANMLAWWPGDGNANDIQGGHNGSLSQGAGYAPGLVADGFNFPLINERVMVPDDPAWDLGSRDFTLDTWVRFNTTREANALIAHDEGPGNNPKWIFWLIDRGGQQFLEFYSYPGAGAINVPWQPALGQWYHVAVTRSGSTFLFYVNGYGIGNGIYPGPIDDANAPLTLGYAENNISLDGMLDEVEIFDRALTPAEIQGIFDASAAGKCKSQCVPPPPQLLSWWPGDGNANDIWGGHSGSLSGNAAYAAGMAGQAFSFNGAPGYVIANGTTNIDGGPQATYDAWVFPNSAPSPGEYFGIFGAGDSTLPTWTTQQCRLLYWNRYEVRAPLTGQARFYADCGLDNNENYVGRMTSRSYATDTWHFVAIVFNNGSLDLYVDGVLDNGELTGTGGISINTESYNYVWIGGTVRHDTTDSWVHFDGRIDEVEVFSRALGQPEIRAIYNAGSAGKCKTNCTPAPPDMVSWYKAEGNAVDTISGLDGSPQNGAGYAAGMVGQAFSFDGYDDHVVIPHYAAQNTGAQITIDAWVKLNEPSVGATIFQKRSPQNVGGYVFEVNAPDPTALQFVLMVDGTYHFAHTPTETLRFGVWQHVAATYDGQMMRIFVNGVEKAAQPLSGTIDPTEDPVVIGRNVVNTPFAWNGQIDEIELFNRALSQTEIQAIFSAGSSGKCLPAPTPTPSPTVTPSMSADLMITKTDNRTNVSPGDVTTYTIVVTNNGPAPAVNAMVTDDFPEALTVHNWTCLPQNSALCTLAGAGHIYDNVYLPVGGTVTYTAATTVDVGLSGTLVNTATVTAPPDIIDPNTENNTASDIDNYVISLSGNITHYVNGDGSYLPQPGVTITLTGSNSGTAITDEAGNYTFTNLTSGGTWTVTPAMVNHHFEPGERTVTGPVANVVGVDFLAYNWSAVPSNIYVVNTHSVPGEPVFVPIRMDAQGGERTMIFSLGYPTTVLSEPVLSCGESTAGCVIETLPGLPGKLGVKIIAGNDLEAGVREIAVVRFFTNAGPGVANAPVDFGEEPFACTVRDQAENDLPAWWLNGHVVFANGYEGDVAGRSTGDGSVVATDITLLRRFIVGAEVIDQAFNEFQRADTAPLAGNGDGELLPGDVIQARRFATGLDALQNAAGPGGPPLPPLGLPAEPVFRIADIDRLIRAGVINAEPGDRVSIDIEIVPFGDETAAAFTVEFNAVKLTSPRVTIGDQETKASILTVNMNEAAEGRIGVLLDSAEPLARGSEAKRLVTITFDVAANAAGGETRIRFTDSLAKRGLSDGLGNTLDARYIDGAIVIAGAQAAGVEVSGRVMTPARQGLRNAIVTIAGPGGRLRSTTTGTFGYYRFGDVVPGVRYTVTAIARKYRFRPHVITPVDDITGLNFIAQE